MKLQGSRQVRFRPVAPWFGRRRLILHGGRSSIQLLETALVIEGFLQRLFFFVLVDRFFRMALSEWTTVTVPYSRVLRFYYRGMLAQRIVATLLLWLPVLLLALGAAVSDHVDWGGVTWAGGGLALLAVVLTLYVHLSLYAPRCYLWFRQADGRRAVVSFRVPSKRRRLDFEAQLREYRRATRARGVAMQELSEAELAAPSPGIWVVILLFVLGHQFVVPLSRYWSPENDPAVKAERQRQQQQRQGGFGGQRPPAQQAAAAAAPAAAAAFQGWHWHALWLAAAALPLVLTSLALVARRNEAVRWSAVLSLVVFGILPLFRLLLFGDQQQEDGEGTEAVVQVLFHVSLAVILVWVTAPEPKDEL
jgi:hypothetical protein